MADRPRVSVSPNPIRERVRLDIDGNEIDPRTKRVIKYANEIVQPEQPKKEPQQNG